MAITNKPIKQSIHFNPNVVVLTIAQYTRYFLLPVLAAFYPSFFFYGNNVHDLLFIDLARTLFVYFMIAIVVYFAFLVMYRNTPLKAAIATFIFLIFFNLYGLLENLILKLDWFPVYDYLTMPIALLLAGYSIWFINKLKDHAAKQFWNFGAIVLGGLIIYNIALMLPIEVARLQKTNPIRSDIATTVLTAQQESPDIYYIILDEFSGLAPMREFWKDPVVDQFSDFLKSNGFAVFEISHGGSQDTITEIASRLNFQKYPYEQEASKREKLFDVIADNRVMNYLKQTGYTIVTFNEMQFGYSSAPTIKADVTYNYGDTPTTNLGTFFNDFGMMVADNTMLNVVSDSYKRSGANKHTNMIFFTTNKIGNLREITSPKFVYVHLLVPHAPFIFDEHGDLNPPSSYTDYSYYPGNYKFAIFLAQKMLNNIISDSDPSSPPVIILQSDHGLRNFASAFAGQPGDFTEENSTHILYALSMPGYEPSFSAREMDPINTFPIVFNHLFDAGIPLK